MVHMKISVGPVFIFREAVKGNPFMARPRFGVKWYWPVLTWRGWVVTQFGQVMTLHSEVSAEELEAIKSRFLTKFSKRGWIRKVPNGFARKWLMRWLLSL